MTDANLIRIAFQNSLMSKINEVGDRVFRSRYKNTGETEPQILIYSGKDKLQKPEDESHSRVSRVSVIYVKIFLQSESDNWDSDIDNIYSQIETVINNKKPEFKRVNYWDVYEVESLRDTDQKTDDSCYWITIVYEVEYDSDESAEPGVPEDFTEMEVVMESGESDKLTHKINMEE